MVTVQGRLKAPLVMLKSVSSLAVFNNKDCWLHHGFQQSHCSSKAGGVAPYSVNAVTQRPLGCLGMYVWSTEMPYVTPASTQAALSKFCLQQECSNRHGQAQTP